MSDNSNLLLSPYERSLTAAESLASATDRRQGSERRRGLLWSLVYGGFRPRRRRGRRASDHLRPIIDWHHPTLLFSAVGLLLLCICDAALTLALIEHGASEANPLMALVVGGDMTRFALVKFALTAGGVLILVAIARFTVFRYLRVATLVHVAMLGYGVLIAYELWLAGVLLP